MNIIYEREKKFPNLKYKRLLRIDFYVPFLNLAIEYDGKQHFKPSDFIGKKDKEHMVINLKNIQIRDKIKNDYCKVNGINLIRVNYMQTEEEIKEIIINEINQTINNNKITKGDTYAK